MRSARAAARVAGAAGGRALRRAARGAPPRTTASPARSRSPSTTSPTNRSLTSGGAGPAWAAYWRLEPCTDGRPTPDGPLIDAPEDKFEVIAAGLAVAVSSGVGGNTLRPDLTTVPLDVEPSRAAAPWPPAPATATTSWSSSPSFPRRSSRNPCRRSEDPDPPRGGTSRAPPDVSRTLPDRSTGCTAARPGAGRWRSRPRRPAPRPRRGRGPGRDGPSARAPGPGP